MSRRRRRDDTPRPSVRLPSPSTVRRLTPIVRPTVVVRVQAPPVNLDRRVFHPDGRFRPAPVLVRAARRLVVARPKRPGRSAMQLNHRIGFAIPAKVMICVRRKERREVIFAKRYSGKGARSRKTRNIWSSVQC